MGRTTMTGQRSASARFGAWAVTLTTVLVACANDAARPAGS